MLCSIQSGFCHKQRVMVLLFSLLFFSGMRLSAQGNAATTGSGYCLDFTSNMANGNYVDLGPLVAIDTGNFSIEMWVNVNACKGDPAFFSNKDWSSGNNPGIVFDVHDNGTKLRVNLKASNSNFQNIIIPINSIGSGWFHLAVTLDRSEYLKIYIDGILKNMTYVSNTIVGSFTSPYTYKLGQDGTGAYSDDDNVLLPYDGKLDEIRFWKVERTEEEIRENMCKRISPHSENLYAYYVCDTTAGDIVKDLTGLNHGKWMKGLSSSWKVSGAPIGDTSIALYPELQDWSDKELALQDVFFGSIKIKNVQALEGIHLYKINSKPNSINGMSTFADNSIYYGVFPSGITNVTSYDVLFEYADYQNAVKDEDNLKLFIRNQNSAYTWSEYMATLDKNKKSLIKQNSNQRREYMLGTATGVLCQATSAFKMETQTDTSCTLSWTSASSQWNIEWGVKGFELGTGSYIANNKTNPLLVTGLKRGIFYEFYIQDKCTSSESYWTGPFLFYPETCLAPSNFKVSNITDKSALLTWKGNGYKSDVEWGVIGFTLGQGIPDSTFNDSLLLRGLFNNSGYAYYVKSNCPDQINNYNGPFTFKTLDKVGIDENKLSHNLTIYPNPSNGEFTMFINTMAKQVNVHIYNAIGKEILNTKEINKNGSIEQTYQLGNGSKGMYFIHITDGIDIVTKQILIY